MIARGKCDVQMIYEKFIETSTFLKMQESKTSQNKKYTI
jgi:hypothetical protein